MILLFVNLKDLAAKGNKSVLTETLDLSDLLTDRLDIAEFGTLSAELQANRQEGVTEVTGTLTLPLKLICSRCLNSVDEILQIPFRETFALRKSDIPKDEEDETHLISSEQVDLRPYVEGAVWMAIPYVPVCQEQCRGLCPVCGRNRNEENCECMQKRIDPRLAGLADFFDK